MSSEIIAAIDKEIEAAQASIKAHEGSQAREIETARQRLVAARECRVAFIKPLKARIKHLERVRKVETGEAKVVVTRDGGAE